MTFKLSATAMLAAMAMLFNVNIACANEDYVEEHYVEEPYQDSYVQEEEYGEATYQEEPYEQPYQEPAYEEPAYEEPQMDSYQATQVKEVRSQCEQWARESGMEGEDKTVFVDDCVYSQTGF